MKTTIEIEIDDALLAEVAQHALRRLFDPPSYRDSKRALGYAIIEAQVEEFIPGMDFRALIRAEVEATLKKLLRAQVRALHEEGALLPKEGS